MPDELTVESAKAPGLDTASDAQARHLTNAVAHGNEEAFERLYDLYQARLTRFVVVTLRGDEQLSAEIIQATFLTAAQKMKPLDGEKHLWNWLARVARQQIAKAWRASGRQEVSLSDGLTDDMPEAPARDTVLEESLNRAILALDPDERQVVEWHYFENLSHKEIAERLGSTPKAVSSRLERARARIRITVNQSLTHDTQ